MYCFSKLILECNILDGAAGDVVKRQDGDQLVGFHHRNVRDVQFRHQAA